MRRASTLLAGLALGFSLSFMGFTDFGEVHKMFTFSDLRLFLTFLAGVSLTGVGLWVWARKAPLQLKPFHPGIIPGSVLFGAGWAMTGACPGAALAQLGEGQLPALVSLIGIAGGMAGYRAIHQRFFRWDRASCAD